MKFLAVESQTQQDSGSDKKQFYQKCKLIFEKCYPTCNFDDILCLCKEYLQEKPKYMAYCKVTNEENEKKKDQPIGTKRPKQEEKDGKIIKKALKEAGCHKQGWNTAVAESICYDKVVGVLKKLSKVKLVQYLDTPDRKACAKEQLALCLAKARLKCAKLKKEMAFAEAPPKEVDLVTSSNYSSNSEVTSATAPSPSNTVCGAGDYCFSGTAMRLPLAVICSNCKLRCHADCDDEGGVME